MPIVTIDSILVESVTIKEEMGLVSGDSRIDLITSSLGLVLMITGLEINIFPLSCYIIYFTSFSLAIYNGILVGSISSCVYSRIDFVESQTPSINGVLPLGNASSKLFIS